MTGAENHATPTCPPVSIVIFGASGDLTRRKLLPALYALHKEGFLSAGTSLIGVARSEMSDDQFRERMKDAAAKSDRISTVDDEGWSGFCRNMSYIRGELDEDRTFIDLEAKLKEMESSQEEPPVRLYYLAIPPVGFPLALRSLAKHGLSRPERGNPVRIIIEKPFGHDLESARELNDQVHSAFEERQVYRIDHYLGKETVQNILVFRLANGILEPLWNRRYIDHVQITVAESIGIADRGAYFDRAGILRDIVQNHMLQLLCLVGMEPPVRFNPDQVRNEKVKVLMSLNPLTDAEMRTAVVRGQYTEGEVEGKRVQAYRSEPKIGAQSRTETFVALRATLDNWRWAGVPFYLRAGKRMKARTTRIVIHFRRPPLALFRQSNDPLPQANALVLQIQPEEGISLRVGSKRPGGKLAIDPVDLQFRYETSFHDRPPEAYERLLYDAINGDSTLFAREDEVEYAWRFITPIIQHWQSDGDLPVHPYWSGSWGPEAADQLIETDGRRWHDE